MQTAVISTVNDNYDDVYHGVREGYLRGYQPMAGDFEESLDYGDIYGRLEEVLGLSYQGGTRVKFTEDGKTEFRVWGLDVDIENAPLAGGGQGRKPVRCQLRNRTGGTCFLWRQTASSHADHRGYQCRLYAEVLAVFKKVFYCPHRLLKPLVVGCALNKEVLHKRLW